jgi:hypothetical protein
LNFLDKMIFYMVIIDVMLDPPINEVIPHLDGFLEIKLTSPEEPEQVYVIELLEGDFVIGLDMSLELGEGLQLLLGAISGESWNYKQRYPEYYLSFYFFFPPNQDIRSLAILLFDKLFRIIGL